jgi:hypothetical protein
MNMKTRYAAGYFTLRMQTSSFSDMLANQHNTELSPKMETQASTNQTIT